MNTITNKCEISEQRGKQRGRPKKHLTEEERREANAKCWRRPERKQYTKEYLITWRDNNREHVNEVARKYRLLKKEKALLLTKEELA